MASPTKVNLSISRPSRGSERGEISIRIRCTISRLEIMELGVPLADFAEILTGLSEVEVPVSRFITENAREFLGMQRETMGLSCPKVWNKDEQRRLVVEDMTSRGMFDKGWEIYNDGTGSRQDGERHNYSAFRHVDPEVGSDDS